MSCMSVFFFCFFWKSYRNSLLGTTAGQFNNWVQSLPCGLMERTWQQETHNGKKIGFHPRTRTSLELPVCSVTLLKGTATTTSAEGHESEPRLDRQKAVLKQSAPIIRSFPFGEPSLATWSVYNDESSTPLQTAHSWRSLGWAPAVFPSCSQSRYPILWAWGMVNQCFVLQRQAPRTQTNPWVQLSVNLATHFSPNSYVISAVTLM